MGSTGVSAHSEPWNKGKIAGQKAPFKLKDIWALRVRFQMKHRVRELALFNLGIDSKLRGCDLVALKVRDVCHGDQVATRAIVLQHKTQRPIQFEITPATRDALRSWIKQAGLKSDDFIFPAGSTNHLTSALASTPGSSGTGSTSWAWTAPTTGPTQCAGQRRH
jgi:integrase